MWFYKGKEFTEDDIQNNFGFVYQITNLLTNRKYIGKKFFTKSSRKQKNGKIKRIRVSSDWFDYYGSNKALLEEIQNSDKNNYKREILYLCKTRSECSYYESLEIFKQEALISKEFYNDWISCKIRKDHLKHLIKPGTNTYDIPEAKE